MRSAFPVVLVAATMAACVAAAPGAAQTPDTRPGIAVLPFTNGGSYGAAREDLDALQSIELTGIRDGEFFERSYAIVD